MNVDPMRRALAGLAVALPLAAAAQPVASGSGEGEVRRIAREQNKLTLRHGEIKALEMPPMSMVFTVRDPALLDKVKVGDRVRFTVEKTADGTFVVTALQPAAAPAR